MVEERIIDQAIDILIEHYETQDEAPLSPGQFTKILDALVIARSLIKKEKKNDEG